MKRRHHSFKVSPTRHSPVGWFLVVVAGLFILGGISLSPARERGNPYEESLAFEEDRDAFWQEVQQATGDWIENAGRPVWANEVIAQLPQKFPAVNLTQADAEAEVLSSHVTPEGVEKRIEVDLSEQRLRAYEGDHLSFDFWVSTGKDGYETVQGEFRVWYKVKYKAYRGGSRRRGDYYYLPNVPFSLFFYKGYAIHGAYWHNKFGQERVSRGCVNMWPEEAKLLWYWAGPAIPSGKNAVRATADNPGVRVIVHE